MPLKSPLQNVWRQFIPVSHDQSLTNAFYNVAAAVFIGGAAAAAWSVYHILQPFIQALIWAVLCGSVLHPIKYKVAAAFKKWLIEINETNSRITISVICLPVNCIDNLSELIGWYVMNHFKAVVTVTVVLPVSYIAIHYTPSALSHLTFKVFSLVYNVSKITLDVIESYNIIFLLIAAVYVIMVTFFLTKENEKLYRRLSLPIWILTSASISCFWPSIRMFLFLSFILLLIGGVIKEIVEFVSTERQNNSQVDVKAIYCKFFSLSDEEDRKSSKMEDISNEPPKEETKNSSELERDNEIDASTLVEEHILDADNTRNSPPARPQHINLKSSSEKEKTESLPQGDKYDSNKSGANSYLKIVFIACILVELWHHFYVLCLVPVAIGYYAVKKFTTNHILGTESFKGKVCSTQKDVCISFSSWFESRKSVLITPPLLWTGKLLQEFDRKIVHILIVSIDGIVTSCIMIGCLMFVIMTTIFLAVQIQGEGMQLVAVGSQVINSTIVNNPQLNQLFPEGLNTVIAPALENSYLYGREMIENMIRRMFGETDDEKIKLLEEQIIELWDRVYQAWVVAHPQSPYSGPVVTSEAVADTFDSIIDGIRKTPGLISFTTLSSVFKDNFGTIMNVAEGLWSILMNNLTLALSAFTTMFSLLLGGSLSILNGILNMVVFLSSLFYILNISDEIYKPVAFLSQLAPGQMNSLGSAVEESVNGVFKASFKMGAFYGMWTWLLHSLFATNIVYIPAVLGALFGAVPLVGTYWAAFPGALELFWTHESPLMGLLLIVAQLLPLSCVDTAFYSEIKGGGHPYLTGLAVAGGIFCWGVQGAILGPLLLCILLVITKMYTSLIQPSTRTFTEEKLKRSQSQYAY